MKKILVISIILGLVFITTGFAQAQKESTLKEVKKRGYLIAGVKNDSPPFGFLDKDGVIKGFDIDMVKYIAKDLGVGLKLVPVTAKTRVPLLLNGNVDLVAASFSHYIDRDEVIDFSISYLVTVIKFLVRKGEGINGHEDLAGKTLGVVQGTPVEKMFLPFQPKGKISTFQDYPFAFLALKEKKVDAVATDDVILYSMAKGHGDLEVVGELPLPPLEMGIGVRENDSKWRDAINFALIKMWEDKTYHNIYREHFGTAPPKGFSFPSWKY